MPSKQTARQQSSSPPESTVRIAVARDAAFGFYYPDDIEALQQAGAELVPFSPLWDEQLPEDIDGLFIGGGFPETQMAELESNTSMRQSIHEAIEAGLPCYAECGGLMYLSRSVRWGDECHNMVGIVPGDTIMHEKPVGRGYAQIVETGAGPWPQTEAETRYRVHEFHYSSLENLPQDLQYAYRMERGHGIDRQHDGFVYKNLLANYVHLRDVAGNHWTRRFVDFVRDTHHRTEGSTANSHMGSSPYLPPFM